MKDKALAVFKEQMRFYLSTPDKVAEALIFIKSAEEYIKEVKVKVKERAVEVMDKNQVESMPYRVVDPDTGEVRDYVMRRDYGKQTKEYNPETVIEVLGVETAVQFLKVGKVGFEKFLKNETSKGSMSMETMAAATKDPVIKTISGSGVKITPVK